MGVQDVRSFVFLVSCIFLMGFDPIFCLGLLKEFLSAHFLGVICLAYLW